MTQPPIVPSNAADDQPVLRRPSARTTKFTHREPVAAAADSVTLQRHVLRSSAAGDVDRQTSRKHVIAGDLPAWEPLPPGELFLSR